jgi:tight adherence protein B
MRGVAVLCAVGSVWALTGNRLPERALQFPKIDWVSVGLSVVTGFGVFVMSFGVLAIPVPAAALGALAATLPIHIRASRSRKRTAMTAHAWPDVLAHIRSSVSGGMTLPDAYISAASRVGGTFEETLAEVRRQVMYGDGFAAAMRHVRNRASDPTADRVTMTLIVANESGGHRVGEVLAALSASVAGESRLRQAHEAAMTEQRVTAGVALAAPWVILALSIATNPQAALAFSTAEGAVVVAIGLVLTISGWILSARIASLSDTPRMFK